MGNFPCKSCQVMFGMGKGSAEIRNDVRYRKNLQREKHLEIEYTDSTYNIYEGYSSSIRSPSLISPNQLFNKKQNSLTFTTLQSPKQEQYGCNTGSDIKVDKQLIYAHNSHMDAAEINEIKDKENEGNMKFPNLFDHEIEKRNPSQKKLQDKFIISPPAQHQQQQHQWSPNNNDKDIYLMMSNNDQCNISFEKQINEVHHNQTQRKGHLQDMEYETNSSIQNQSQKQIQFGSINQLNQF